MRCLVTPAFITTIGCSKTVQLFDQNCHTSAFQIFRLGRGWPQEKVYIFVMFVSEMNNLRMIRFAIVHQVHLASFVNINL